MSGTTLLLYFAGMALGIVGLFVAGTIRGEGAYEGADRPGEAGVTITSANAVIENRGIISSAGQGIVTQLYYNDDTAQLEMRAANTSVTNSGTIRGESNDAIRLFGGGSVTNSGTISAFGVSIVGKNAGELLLPFSQIITGEASTFALGSAIISYPTRSEIAKAAAFAAWEPTVFGRLPKKYAALVAKLRRTLN